MKTFLSGAVLAAGFIFASATVYAGPPARAGATANSPDITIVQTICDESVAVQRIGEMANQRSQNIRVKEVGQKLALDYGNTRLQFNATALAVGAPITPQLTVRASRAMEKLEGLSGMAFDKAALHELVKSQQAVLRKIQDESAQGDIPALKQLAALSLSPLQDDIYQVVTLESDLDMAATAATGASATGLAFEP
jgi:predicted outer membrane protein